MGEAESEHARRALGSGGVGEDDCEGDIEALLFLLLLLLLLLRCALCREQLTTAAGGETTFFKPTFGGRWELLLQPDFDGASWLYSMAAFSAHF